MATALEMTPANTRLADRTGLALTSVTALAAALLMFRIPCGRVRAAASADAAEAGNRLCRAGDSCWRETRQKDFLVIGIRQTARGRSSQCKKAFIPPTSAMFWRTTVEVGARPAGKPTGLT